MKIGFIDTYSNSLGGAPKSMLALMSGIKESYNCELITLRKGTVSEKCASLGFNTIISHGSSFLTESRKYKKNLFLFTYYLICHWISSFRKLNKTNYDVIYINEPRAFLYYFPFILFNSGKTIYYTRINTRIPIVNSLILILVKKLILISKDTKNAYNSVLFNIFKYKATVLNTGFDFLSGEVRATLNDKILVCNVGTLCKRKNQLMLLESIAKLRKMNNKLDFEVHLFAEYDTRDAYTRNLINFVESNNLTDVVFFRGYSENIYFEISEFDVLVSSSLLEGLPRVCIEALSQGLYVISTDIYGVSDILKNKEHGQILTHNTVDELSIKLSYCIDKKEEISAMSARKKRSCYSKENFSMSRFTLGFTDILKGFK
ncbi:glycosyltransferase [Vibrio breoganii]